MQEPILQFTPAAEQHLNKIIELDGKAKALRLSIKQTGCSGFMYIPELVETGKPNDLPVVGESGLQVFVDPQCAKKLRGSIVDLVNRGLGQEQLVFHNPNVASACGCGESVHFEEE